MKITTRPGLDDKQARTWRERQVPAILRELVGVSVRAPRLTIAEFYEQRFLPEHVQLLKPATRISAYGIVVSLATRTMK